MPVFTVNALHKRTLDIHLQWVGGLLWAKSCANVLITVWVAVEEGRPPGGVWGLGGEARCSVVDGHGLVLRISRAVCQMGVKSGS